MATASDDQADKLGVDPNMVGAYEVLDLRAALSASESARREAEEKLGHADERASWSRVWTIIETLGIGGGGCPDHQIVHHVEELRSALASERAARERAEGLLSECDDELENASCPPMTNETIPERIARLAGLVSSTARDEQTALEGKVAAESRLAEAEAALREMRETFRWHIVAWVRKDEARMLRHIEEIDAFLAGGKS